ncbi:hypothetical protein [Tumebacillus algifaecis]|nr:hypothetical protein [Tumebacillus algifaecis]
MKKIIVSLILASVFMLTIQLGTHESENTASVIPPYPDFAVVEGL